MILFFRFKQLLQSILWLLIGVIVISCSSKDHPNVIKPQKSEVSYKYSKNVVVQTKKRLSYIKEVKDSSLIYSSETPSKYIPKADDIISSGINDIFPHGIGVRVTDTRILPNGDIECSTTPATLDQIFEELKISSHTNLINGKNGEVTAIDKDGNEVKLKVVTSSDISKQRAGYNKNFLFVYPLSLVDLSIGKKRSDVSLEIPFHEEYKINPNDIGVSLGKLSLGKTEHYNFAGNIHAGLGLIYECDLKAKIYKFALDANCGFEITEWLFENDVSRSIELFDYEIVNQYIDLGPVVLNTTLHLVLDAEAYNSGYFRCFSSKEVGIELGITQDGAYEQTYNKGNQDKLIQIDSLNAKIGTCLPFHPNVVVGLYDEGIVNGKIEPSISFGLEADCQLDNDELFKLSPTLKLYTRGDLDVSANFLEGIKISLSTSGNIASFNIWEKGWPLLPVLDSKSLTIGSKKSGEKYNMSFNFSSDGIIQKWRDNMRVGAVITSGDSLITKQPDNEGDIISAKKTYKYTFDNLSLQVNKSYMAKPEIVWNNRTYNTNGIAFAVSGVTFNTKDYYIKSVKYYDAYSDEDYGCDFWNRDHYHYYHDLIFEVDGSDRCAEIGNQCTTDDYHRELSLDLHDGILKGQYVYLTTNKVSSFMVETVPYAYMLNGERLTFEPYQFRLWRDESIVSQWYK